MSRTIRLGIFVVAALAMFAGGVFLIGNKRLLFSKTYSVKAQFETVAGLDNGADVRVGGIHQGTVRRIRLPKQPDGKVIVEMDLGRETRDVIKKDSVASIQSEGLVGDKYVAVSFGSKDGAPIKDGDTIAAQPPLEISALFKKADDILTQGQDAMRSVNGSAQNLESISAKVNQGKGTVGALINDKGMYQRINQGATAFQDDMEALKHNFLLRGFFKNRGYDDATELTKHQIHQLPAGQYDKKFAFDAKRLFDKPDTAKLKNAKALNQAGQFLEGNPYGMVVVAAHGSTKGDTDKENQLTEAQSAVVRDYLVRNFKVDDTRIKTMGLGKSEDPANENTVEILVYPKAVPPVRVAGKR